MPSKNSLHRKNRERLPVILALGWFYPGCLDAGNHKLFESRFRTHLPVAVRECYRDISPTDKRNEKKSGRQEKRPDREIESSRSLNRS